MKFSVDKNKLNIINQRNKILAAILWITLIPALNNQIKTDTSISTMFLIDSFIVIPALLATFSVLKKKLTIFAMYVGSIGSALGFLGGLIDTKLYAPVFISLLLIALYQEWKALIINASILLLGFNLHYKQYVSLEGEQLILFHIMFALCLGILLSHIFASEKVRKKFIQKQEELEVSNVKVEQMLENTKKSEQKLSEFNQTLNQNLNQLKDIATGIVESFKDITNGVENQTGNIKNVNFSLKDIGNVISQVTVNSKEMSESSNQTELIVVQHNKEIQNTIQEIAKVSDYFEATVQLIQELNEKNKVINQVLETLDDISNQTEMLGINASIEAAHAGIHGQGFTIVASEVKKLSEDSKTSYQGIAEILNEITHKTAEVQEQINEGLQIIINSKNTLLNSERTFSEVNKNARLITKQSNENEQTITNLKNSSDKIIEEMNSIAVIAEQVNASIEEILSSTENQSQNIEGIISSFEDLQNKSEH